MSSCPLRLSPQRIHEDFQGLATHFSRLISPCPAPIICASTMLSIPSCVVLPRSLSQIDPSERSPKHSPPLSSPHPYNPTPCSFSFPLPFTVSSAHIPLRINHSLGLSQWNLKCPDYVTCINTRLLQHALSSEPQVVSGVITPHDCQRGPLESKAAKWKNWHSCNLSLCQTKQRHNFPVAFHADHLARTPWDLGWTFFTSGFHKAN